MTETIAVFGNFIIVLYKYTHTYTYTTWQWWSFIVAQSIAGKAFDWCNRNKHMFVQLFKVFWI